MGVILAVPLYVVALVLRIGLGEFKDNGNGAQLFQSLATSYFTCFRCWVAGDCTDSNGMPIFVLVVQAYGWWFGVFYCFLTVLFSVALFNVIVAIYVENTVEAAKKNELVAKRARLTDEKMFNVKARQLVSCLMRHTDGVLHLMGVQQILRDLDVEDEEQHDLFDTLDVDGGGTLDLEELISGIAKLRGEARRSDIISVGLRVRSTQDELQAFMENTSEQLRSQSDNLRDLLKFLSKTSPSFLFSRAASSLLEVHGGRPVDPPAESMDFML